MKITDRRDVELGNVSDPEAHWVSANITIEVHIRAVRLKNRPQRIGTLRRNRVACLAWPFARLLDACNGPRCVQIWVPPGE